MWCWFVSPPANPPEYNGFKVYWSDGAQLTPPYDSKIIALYEEIGCETEIKKVSYAAAVKSGLIREVGDELDAVYLRKASALSLREIDSEDFKIVYTPLHGTGGTLVCQLLDEFGFNTVVSVAEQTRPDGISQPLIRLTLKISFLI